MISKAPASLTDDALYTWGQRLLAGTLVLSLGLMLLVLWHMPEAIVFIPVALVLGFVVSALIRAPLVHLCIVLAGTASILGYGTGIAPHEIVYGLYYLSYLTGWYIYHVFFARTALLRTPEDKVLILFLLYATATFGLTILLQGDIPGAFSQWLPLTILAFYFPIKVACARYPQATLMLAAVFAFLAIFVAIRNFYVYYVELQQAEAIWQILTGRERLNERFLMVGFLGVLAFSLQEIAWYKRILFLSAGALFLAGILIGQSRTIWISIGLGLAILFLLVPRRQKILLLIWSLGGFVVLLGLGSLLLENFFNLILSGLLERFISIGTAITQDTSLVNRFVEWQAAWERIKLNPLLGYGFDVPYHYFSLVYHATVVKSHIHSTYLGLWYRHGLIGLSLFLMVFMTIIWRGYVLLKLAHLPRLLHLVVVICVSSLGALALAATTEDLLLGDEGMLILVFPMGLIAGIWQRYFFSHAHSSDSDTLGQTSSPKTP